MSEDLKAAKGILLNIYQDTVAINRLAKLSSLSRIGLIECIQELVRQKQLEVKWGDTGVFLVLEPGKSHRKGWLKSTFIDDLNQRSSFVLLNNTLVLIYNVH